METYFLVKRDGTFYEEDGTTLFTIDRANEIAAAQQPTIALAIQPAFVIPAR